MIDWFAALMNDLDEAEGGFVCIEFMSTPDSGRIRCRIFLHRIRRECSLPKDHGWLW
ncbi:hypothetical protein EMIT0215P_50063 [Pseudomonas serboccidentalis]